MLNWRFREIEGLAEHVVTASDKAILQDIWEEEYEETMAWYEESGEGFGSSDMSHLLSSVINRYLCCKRSEYRAEFRPYLKVVKVSSKNS
jgi:hypothetical protein